MTDVANFFANHPPAIKVGGRRHSISTFRHRPHPAPEPAPAVAPTVAEPLDYPRPAPPQPPAGEEAIAHLPPPQHNDEEAPRKDKRHDGNERKLMELAQRKAEMTRPTRIQKNNTKGFGAAGRIAQPAKELHV
ncbi:hypothetical protein MSAN_02083700 [Mycena sanguinolenta]|uniref:Uncharacterized protein n=1 Tax=Mycena sanguinolenta TaxID=230812 RepID=A0A8H6XGE0_9AGAR|nr:hypothetical protein MSAN_02083700 [Mycena sanguinolenta]